MTRIRERPLQSIPCRGCGVVFRDHRRSRAYCSDDCRLLYKAALLFRCCCGVSREFEIVVSFSPADKLVHEADSRRFASGHRACRIKYLESIGRELSCRCVLCDERSPAASKSNGSQRKLKRERSLVYRNHGPEVFERDNLVCQICLLPTDPRAHPSDDMYPTLDHVLQVRWGGSDDLDNLRTAHRWCNIKREHLWGDDQTIREQAEARFSGRVE